MVKPMQCPSYAATPMFEYPFSYRVNFNMGAGTSYIFVVAPINDVLAHGTYQNVCPPSAGAAVAPWNGSTLDATITDPYLTNLLSGVSTSASTSRPSTRPTSMCVELSAIGPLQALAGEIIFAPWEQGSLAAPGFASGGTWTSVPVSFNQIYSNIIELPKYKLQPAAEFSSTKCIHLYMRDRTAMEPTFTPTGIDPWIATYMAGYPNNSTSSIGVGVPWTPMVVYIGNTSSTQQSYSMTIRGTMDVNPALGSAYFRLAKIPPVPTPNAEERWWQHCRALAAYGLRDAAVVQRSTAGITGIKPQAKRQPKKNLRNTTTTQAPNPPRQPRPYRGKFSLPSNQMPRLTGQLANALANAVANGGPWPRMRQAALVDRGDLRRRRR